MLTLVDTDVLIRLRTDDPLIGANAKELLSERFENGQLAVAAVSFNEVSRLVEKGVIELDMPVLDWCRRCTDGGIRLLTLSAEVSVAAPQLTREGFHGDPFDQIIVATALGRECPLATTDRSIIAWAEKTGKLRILNARK